MIYRREAVLGGLLTILWSTAEAAANCCEGDEFDGCGIEPETFDALYANGSRTIGHGVRFGKLGEIRLSSGDRYLDVALGNTLVDLSETMQVLPGFAFLQESGGRNAYASPSKALGRADGSVLLGLKWLRNTLGTREKPDAQIAGVCAHEFAHIVMYKYNLRARLGRSLRVELHADVLTGYYAGLRKRRDASFPAEHVALGLHQIGSSNGEDRSHGTPEERGRAAVEGFKMAYDQSLPLGEAIERGIAIAKAI